MRADNGPYVFSRLSEFRLSTCHPDLQKVMRELIKEFDFKVLDGWRCRCEQNDLFYRNRTQLMWPHSKHNKKPSEAIDIAPYNPKFEHGVDWNDIPAFSEMLLRVECIAKRLGVKLRFGRDFSFKDWPHVELHDKHGGRG